MWTKEYTKEYHRLYRLKNAEKLKERSKLHYRSKKEHYLRKFKEYYLKNKDKIRDYNDEYYKKDIERWRLYHKKYRQLNKDKAKEYQKNYRIEYCKENKDKIAAKNKHWLENNREKARELCRRRQTNKLNRTPKWLTKQDFDLIKEFYKCPKTHSVDHIIPLQGKEVSGLHVPWNLQVLTRSENGRKSISFDGTYENEGWRTKVR